jgi:predicted peptidase
VSDDQGHFRFGDAPGGSCAITADLQGFKSANKTVVVSPSEPVDVALRLDTDVLHEEVTVIGSLQTIDSTTMATHVETINAAKLQVAPIASDRFQDALPLTEARYRVEKDAAHRAITGLSMGGYGAWNLGVSYPEKFAAIAPICGGGEGIAVLLASREKAGALKTLGVWAFHGAKDPVVPVTESERMVAALKKAGVAEVKLTIYPEAGHDSWTETYRNPALYEWLLQHERK